jgi:hypothetical protein
MLSSAILLIVIMMGCEMTIQSSFIVLLTSFLYWIANIRLWGLAGVIGQASQHGNALLSLFVYREFPEVLTRDYVLAFGFTITGGADVPPEGFAPGLFTAAASYRMASLTKTNVRNVFKVMLIALIIAPLGAYLGLITVSYIFGVTRTSLNTWVTGCNLLDCCWASPGKYSVSPGGVPWWPHMLFGVVFIGLLSYLHSKFVWFPFEPIGFSSNMAFLSLLALSPDVC